MFRRSRRRRCQTEALPALLGKSGRGECRVKLAEFDEFAVLQHEWREVVARIEDDKLVGCQEHEDGHRVFVNVVRGLDFDNVAGGQFV